MHSEETVGLSGATESVLEALDDVWLFKGEEFAERRVVDGYDSYPQTIVMSGVVPDHYDRRD